MRSAILGARPDQLGHLGLHQLLRNPPDGLADHVCVLIAQHLPDDLEDRHPVLTGIAGLLSSTPWNEPTTYERRGDRTTFDPSEPLFHRP